jgi:hypothetical protein
LIFGFGRDPGGGGLIPGPLLGAVSVIAANKAHQLALNFDLVWSEHAGLIARIGGFERDRAGFLAKTL